MVIKIETFAFASSYEMADDRRETYLAKGK